jgi:hypothetical protein
MEYCAPAQKQAQARRFREKQISEGKRANSLKNWEPSAELNTDGLRKNHAQTVGQKKRRGVLPLLGYSWYFPPQVVGFSACPQAVKENLHFNHTILKACMALFKIIIACKVPS